METSYLNQMLIMGLLANFSLAKELFLTVQFLDRLRLIIIEKYYMKVKKVTEEQLLSMRNTKKQKWAL